MLVSDWLITYHVTQMLVSDWLMTHFLQVLEHLTDDLPSATEVEEEEEVS